jgi:PD-(D/E)XK nuclease superfamily
MAIEPIKRVSPSLFARLERCSLTDALSRLRTKLQARPSGPSARLGTAAHVVLGRLVGAIVVGNRPTEVPAWVRAEWQSQIALQYATAQSFEEESALGPPQGWPGFFDVEARLVIEATRIVDDEHLLMTGQVYVERWIQDDVLGLEGRPDLVITGDGGSLTEYKTGRPGPSDVQPGSTYANQIAIYSALLRTVGITVASAAIQPVGLAPLPVTVSRDDEARVVERAAALAARFNAAVTEGRAHELGSPSDAACRWCPHAARCPALWESLDAFAELHSIEGDVVATTDSARAKSIQVDVERGTCSGLVTVVGLRPLGAMRNVAVGDHVRLAGLTRKEQPHVLAAPRAGWVRSLVAGPGDATTYG